MVGDKVVKCMTEFEVSNFKLRLTKSDWIIALTVIFVLYDFV
jgi:hypothetical protein